MCFKMPIREENIPYFHRGEGSATFKKFFSVPYLPRGGEGGKTGMASFPPYELFSEGIPYIIIIIQRRPRSHDCIITRHCFVLYVTHIFHQKMIFFAVIMIQNSITIN